MNNRSLKRIPIRILVNGTRGKSTTVRIFYELLRVSGKKVFAKTTGNEPLEFLPDGTVQPVKRFAPTSIIENRRILWRWAKYRPDAFIMECMALQPETQHILGRRLVKPTITIITNILPDHKEVMGMSLKDAACSMAECLVKESELFHLKSTVLPALPTNLFPSHSHSLSVVSCPFILPHIPPQVLNESWTLVQAVADFLGINQQTTKRIFRNVWQEVDADMERKISENVCFYDLFSANDIRSAQLFVEHILRRKASNANLIFYLNCRADRPLRTRDFAMLLAKYYPDSEVWLTGEGWPLAKRLLRQTFSSEQIRRQPIQKALQDLHAIESEKTILFGLGNHKGMDLFLKKIKQNTKEVRHYVS